MSSRESKNYKVIWETGIDKGCVIVSATGRTLRVPGRRLLAMEINGKTEAEICAALGVKQWSRSTA